MLSQLRAVLIRVVSCFALRLALWTALVLSVSAVSPSKVQAADGNGVQIGLITGAGLVNGLVSFTYGFSVGYRYGANFVFGVNYNAQALGVPPGFLSGYSATCGVSSLLGEAQYHFTDFLQGTYLALKAGLIFSSASLTGAALAITTSTADLGFGGAAGYLFRPSDKFTLGPELSVNLDPAAGVTLVNLLGRVNFKF